MVTAIVRYELAPSMSAEDARANYDQAVAKFQAQPGLIRKYFMLSEDGRIGSSVYLWESRELALAFHDEDWKNFMQGKYGNRPVVELYHCQIVVDNLTGHVIMN